MLTEILQMIEKKIFVSFVRIVIHKQEILEFLLQNENMRRVIADKT